MSFQEDWVRKQRARTMTSVAARLGKGSTSRKIYVRAQKLSDALTRELSPNALAARFLAVDAPMTTVNEVRRLGDRTR